MAATNSWQQFKALIPEGIRVVVTITANNGNGTTQAELRGGSVITVKDESVAVGEKAFVQDGEIKVLRQGWRSTRWRCEKFKNQDPTPVSDPSFATPVSLFFSFYLMPKQRLAEYKITV